MTSETQAFATEMKNKFSFCFCLRVLRRFSVSLSLSLARTLICNIKNMDDWELKCHTSLVTCHISLSSPLKSASQSTESRHLVRILVHRRKIKWGDSWCYISNASTLLHTGLEPVVTEVPHTLLFVLRA